MSSFEEKLKQKASEQLEMADLTSMPHSIRAIVYGEPEFKQDRQKEECCYITLKLENNKGLKQKYTKTTFKAISEAISKAGGLAELQKNMHQWTKQKMGQSINERFYPEPKK